jgi:hypothetical protein
LKIEALVSEQKAVNFKVKGEPPVQAVPALYSNFLAVSRVGTDVQFEFVFLDLNYMAMMLEQFKTADVTVAPEVEGKTVAKVVMPAVAFMQLHEQFEKIFAALKTELPGAEIANAQRSTSVG